MYKTTEKGKGERREVECTHIFILAKAQHYLFKTDINMLISFKTCHSPQSKASSHGELFPSVSAYKVGAVSSLLY